MARLEQLEELDLSGNRLRSVPTTILSCARMHTLAAHSNGISTFPEVLQLAHIKVCVSAAVTRLSTPRPALLGEGDSGRLLE